MADTVNTNSTTGASSGDSNATLQAITDLQSQLNDMKGQLNSLSESVNKSVAAVSENANFQTNEQGAQDPYENARRDRAAYDEAIGRNRVAYDQIIQLGMRYGEVLLGSMAALAAQSGRHADVAVARHWGTSPETANPVAGSAAAKA